MAVETDEPFALPKPPPPRPAARQAAMDAALRKFDGADDARRTAKRQKRAWWASHQRQLGAFATAAVIALVSVPVALTVLREQPKPLSPPADSPATVQPEQVAPPGAAPTTSEPLQTDRINAADVAPSRLPLRPHEAQPLSLAEREQKTMAGAPAPMTAPTAPAPAPPPPPPPPPPAPAPASSGQFADETSAQEMVVTGSRVARGELDTRSNVRVMPEKPGKSRETAEASEAYASFLVRLQGTIRAGDRSAIVALVGVPLRVNFDDGTRRYRDRNSVKRDFDRIFTPRVRQAILDQQADRLFTSYQGAMVGNGEVWFDHSCSNASCSGTSPIRIRTINP